VNNFPKQRYTVRTAFLVICAFLVLVIYFSAFIFYPILALQVLIPLALLFLSSVNIYQGIRKLNNTTNYERRKVWYRQYNIIIALAWLSGFIILAFYHLMSRQNFIALEISVIVLLLATMIVLFSYAFILYKANDTN